MVSLGLALASLLAVLSSLGALLLLSYLVSTQRKAPRFSSIQNSEKRTEYPLISVIVTAKNEEKVIEKCLDSILEQSYPNLEVVVVDDSSTDDTNKLVLEKANHDQRIRVVEAGPKPEGWVGKSWPCWRGYESSNGEVFLFVDADSVMIRKECVERAVEYFLDKGLDIFSLTPHVNASGVWALSTLPLMSSAIDILYPMVKVNDPRSSRAYVFGTFILVKRKAYEAIDGHRAVRDLIVEDAAIARRAKSSGLKLRVEQAPEYFTTDWEHERVAIFNGLERVLSSSIRAYGLLAILDAVFIFFVVLYPLLFILGVLLIPHLLFTDWLAQVASLACMLDALFILVIMSIELRNVVGRVGLIPLLYPLGAVLFITAIVTTSIKVATAKGIEWKGASYTQATEERKAMPRIS